MELITTKAVDMLITDSVSILTRKYVEIDGTTSQVGENHRCAYVNSERGRALLQANEPENVVSAVFAIWGDTPTVVEEIPDVETIE